MKRTKTLLAIFFLGLLGIADASYLTVLKATDEIRGSVQSEMCSAISETGCRIALESPASSLFGFPVSLLAIVTYLIVAGMALRIWLGGPRREFWTDSLKLVALGAVAYSLTLAGYSQLKNSWCPFCIGLYGINTLLLIASASLPGRFRAAFGSVFGNRRGLAVALTLFVVGNAAALGIFRYTVTRLSGDVRARRRPCG